MPIYEYCCRKCEAKFEALQRVGADGRDLTCPTCGEAAPERVLSAFAAGGVESRSCSSRGRFT